MIDSMEIIVKFLIMIILRQMMVQDRYADEMVDEVENDMDVVVYDGVYPM